MKKNYFYRTVILLGLSMFLSCQKEESIDPVIASSQDNAEVSALYDEIDNEVTDRNNMKSALIDGYDSAGTRIITDTTIGDKRIITITYNNFINGWNTRIKNGKIIITIDGKYANQDFPYECVVRMKNFTINGNKIEGVRTVTKDSLNPLKFHIKLDSGKVTFTDGSVYTRTVENRIRTWTAGYLTPLFVWDDEYSIEGSASGVNTKGEAYTHTITSALQIALGCPWIKAGIIEFTINPGSGKQKSVSLDYGSGTCDNNAVLTLSDGSKHDIKLRGGK